MADTTFEVDIKAGSGEATTASAALANLADTMTRTETANDSMAAAIAAAETSYAKAEKAADAASKALERNAVAAELNRTKMQAAMEAGDETRFWKLAGAARELEIQQGKLQTKSDAAAQALMKEAAALDALRGKSPAAAAGVAKAVKATEDLGKAQKQANKEPFNAKALARDIDVLPGPLGKVASKALKASDDLSGMVEQLGAGTTVALGMAAGVVALVIAMAAVGAAAVVAGAGILQWAFALNPENVTKMNAATARWNATIKKTFGGLKFDKFFNLIDRLTRMFDTSEESGRALKVVFEALFQPLIDQSEKLFPIIERGFLQFEIWVLKALIAIKPFGSKIAEVAKFAGIFALLVGGVLAVAIGLVIGLMVAVVLSVGAWIDMMLRAVPAILAFGQSLISGIVDAFNFVKNAVTGAIAWLQGLSLSEIGTALIDGLINGITSAGGRILGALTAPLKSAVDGAKKFLGIASPAKLLADEVGAPMGQGVAGGVEGETAGIQGSLTTAVTPDASVKNAAAQTGATAGGAASSGAQAAGNFAGAQFVFNGVTGAEDAQGQFAELWFAVMAGDTAKLGAARRA